MKVKEVMVKMDEADIKKRAAEIFRREVTADVSAVDADDKSVELSFSSEAPCSRWFGAEILSHDEGAIDLSRLNEIGVLLFNHNPEAPIGRIEKAWVGDDLRGHATVRFDGDADSEKIFQKVSSGSLRGVSVGYRVGVWESVGEGEVSTNGRFKGPCEVATRWEPLEISIVSVPADAGVGVGRSVTDCEERNDKTMEKNEQLQNQVPNIGPDEKPAAIDAEAVRAEAIKAERARVEGITSLCKSFEMDGAEFIQSGASVEEVRSAVLERLANEKQAVKASVKVDEGDKFRAAAQDGLALRAGISVEKPADGASEFRGLSMLRLAANIYEREYGKSASHMEDKELIRAVMTGGTGAFPNILANVGNKSMAQSYNEAPTTFQFWTAKGSNSDFKPATRVGLGAADELLEMTENGEFKNATVSDYSETTQVKTFGRSYAITRKAIINDDLSVLTQLPAKYGAAARRMVNKMAYDALTGTANLFSTGHGNTGTGALSIANLAAAKAAMAKQKDPSNRAFLNLQPVYLIVPVDKEVVAAQLISSVVDPTKANATPNPFANRLTVVADPNLSDADAWYLATAPGALAGIEVTYLNGNETPIMETSVDFDTLGIKHRIYLDVGVTVLDYRALYKSTGK